MGKILRDRDGSVLIIAVIVVMILTGLCTALLMVSGAQSKSTVISEENIRALYVAEAGISDALAKIASGEPPYDNDFSILVTIPSEDFGVGEYTVIADFKDYGTPTVADDRWFLTAVGTGGKMVGDQIVQAFLDSDVFNNPGFVDPEVTINPAYTETLMMRGVWAAFAPRPDTPFTHAMFGDLDINMWGTVFVDSYDSELPTSYNDQCGGKGYANDKGSIASNSDIDLSNNVTIYGDARPGPDSSAPADGTVSGITAPNTETFEIDPYVYNPPIAPDALTLVAREALEEGAGGLGSGAQTVYRFGGAAQGDIQWTGGNGTISIAPGKDVTIYIDYGLKMIGGEIDIPADSTLTIHHGGWNDPPNEPLPGEIPTASFALGGNGVSNASMNPLSFSIYSETTGSFNLGGNAQFYGAIYCPDASFDPNGTSDIFGAVVAGSVNIGGTANFHYDEALSRIGMGTNGYEQVSWQEFVPVRQ